jgi:TRAP-type C4-dicarboxylate transport system permease small subunit
MSIQQVVSGFVRALEILIGLMLSVILVVGMGEVLSRYITGRSLVWVVELSRFLFVWLSFLAAAVAFHHRMHFRVVLLWRAISPDARRRLELAIDLITFVFASVVLTQSLPVIRRTYVQRSPAMLIPMSYIYLIVPIAAGLIMIFILLRWAEALRAGQLPDPQGSEHA